MNTRSMIISLGCVVLAAFTSCSEKYDGDLYNFSNSLPPYVELKSKTALRVKEGAAVNIVAQVRTARQQAVTVTYAISGAVTRQGVFKIERNATEGTLSLTIPAGTLAAGSTSGSAQLKLTAASAADSTAVTVGRLGMEKETVTINITK